MAGVLVLLRRRAVDRRVQAVVALLALAGFVLLAWPSACVVRAGMVVAAHTVSGTAAPRAD